MSLVLGASATLAFIHEDETTPLIRAVLDRVEKEGALVPTLWRLEVGNSLLQASRRGRITEAVRDKALAYLARLDIRLDPDTDDHAWASSLRLADRYRLTLYDATYLELALRAALPLATLDNDLGRAATQCGVRTMGLQPT